MAVAVINALRRLAGHRLGNVRAAPLRAPGDRASGSAHLSRRTFIARVAACSGSVSFLTLALNACGQDAHDPTALPAVTRTVATVATAAAPPATEVSARTPGAVPTVLAPEAVAWLAARAIPLATAEPGGASADLLPLRAVFGAARLVALGEATHGTHEFFTVKHRLVSFLVEELAFTGLALEVDWAAAVPLDRWVRTGVGDPVALLAGLELWASNTREMLALLRWLRAYNERRGDAPLVGVGGLDARAPHRSAELVLDFLRGVDPGAMPDFAASYALLRTFDQSSYAIATPETRARGREGARRAHEALLARRATYEGASSPATFALALQAARVVVQVEAYWAEADARTRLASRDRFMAENAAWTLVQAGPGAKVVLWAHNEHVGTSAWAAVPEPLRIPSMGGHLRDHYGPELVTCGVSFHEGSFKALAAGEGGLATHRAVPPPADSYEATCYQAGMPRFLVDLRTLPPGTGAGDWLAGPRPLRSIAAAYAPTKPEQSVYAVSLPRKFDLFLFLRESTPSEPLFPFGPLAQAVSPRL